MMPNTYYRRVTAIKLIRKNETVAAHMIYEPPVACASGQKLGLVAQQKEVIVTVEAYDGHGEPFYRRTFDPPLVMNKGDELGVQFQFG